MKIQREQVIKIIKYLNENPNFYFPFKIICKEYASDKNDNNFVEIVSKDDYENLLDDLTYNTFELCEDFQNLDIKTLELMSKGFIEEILKRDIISKISNLAMEYRKSWKEDLWESTDIEEYGLNEFLGGKAEAYKKSLNI